MIWMKVTNSPFEQKNSLKCILIQKLWSQYSFKTVPGMLNSLCFNTYLRITVSHFSKGLHDWHHHGRGGRVGDEHGDDGCRQHEPEHGHFWWSSHLIVNFNNPTSVTEARWFIWITFSFAKRSSFLLKSGSWSWHQKNDAKGDPPMEATVLDADGQHEPAQHHEVCRPHIVDRYLILKLIYNIFQFFNHDDF